MKNAIQKTHNEYPMKINLNPNDNTNITRAINKDITPNITPFRLKFRVNLVIGKKIAMPMPQDTNTIHIPARISNGVLKLVFR